MKYILWFLAKLKYVELFRNINIINDMKYMTNVNKVICKQLLHLNIEKLSRKSNFETCSICY